MISLKVLSHKPLTHIVRKKIFIFGIFVFLISFLKAEIKLNFSNIGSSINIANSSGIGWSSIGSPFQSNEIPASIREARWVQLAFPITGWASEHINTTWKLSPWFGTYEPTSAPWVYHEVMGWIYFHQADLSSIWLWKDELGWVWTNQNLYPYLYQTIPDGWLALNPQTSRPALVFDFPNDTWFKIEKPSITIKTNVYPENAGIIDGLREIHKGENLALFARPKNGYLFSNWQGSYETKDNPLFVDELKTNLSLTAHFESVQNVLSKGNENELVSHLQSQEHRKKAILELAFYGRSSLISNSYSPGNFESQLEFFIHATGDSTSKNPTLIFNEDSGIISHSYAPYDIGNETIAYLEGSSRGIIKVKGIQHQTINSVQCLKIELKFPSNLIEYRWLAQDSIGNVWIVKSASDDQVYNEPFIVLPKEIEQGWKSWSDFSFIPSTYSIHTNYPLEVFAQGVGNFTNCIEALIFREPQYQNEYYAPGYGIVKIYKP